MRILLSLFPLLSLVGCVYSWESEVDLQPSLESDDAFYEAHENATKKASVFDNFETQYDVNVTYLSPEFRTALAKRYEGLFKQPQPILEEATSKAGFLVSVFTPESERSLLSDPLLWTILMKKESTAMKPVLVKKLNRKERWEPFFSYINVWSQEYLVLFDSPSVTPNDPKFVDKTSIQLILANADAEVTFSW